MLQLENKIAVVTGANSGMGMATTRALLDLGAHVIMLCRDKNRGTQAYEKMVQDGVLPNRNLDKNKKAYKVYNT